MPVEPVRALGRFVFDGIEQRKIVGGPGDTGDAFEPLGESAPGVQVFDLQHVLAETSSVGRIGEQVIVFADLEGTQSKVRMTFRKQIQVEQQFFRRAFRVAPTAVERVLLSFFGPGEEGKQYAFRSEEHTSELQSHLNLVCRLLLEKKKKKKQRI